MERKKTGGKEGRCQEGKETGWRKERDRGRRREEAMEVRG